MPSAKVTLGSLDQEIEMSEETASSERPQVTRADWAIVADLRRSISGEVIAGADVPDEFTRDFGGLLRALLGGPRSSRQCPGCGERASLCVLQ